MSIHETNSKKVSNQHLKSENTPQAETKAASARLQNRGPEGTAHKSQSPQDQIEIEREQHQEKQFHFDFGSEEKQEIKKPIRLPQRPSKPDVIAPHKPFPDDKGRPQDGPGLFPGDKNPGIMPSPRPDRPEFPLLPNNPDIERIEPNQPDCWTDRQETPQIEPNQPDCWGHQPIVPPGIRPL